jgi:hypothetical protein
MSAFEITRDGAVAHLKLSRPEASNALDLSFWRDFGPALRALDAPTAPMPAAACLRAELPPAAAWPWRMILVRDLGVLAHSDGVRWIRHDTGQEI